MPLGKAMKKWHIISKVSPRDKNKWLILFFLEEKHNICLVTNWDNILFVSIGWLMLTTLAWHFSLCNEVLVCLYVDSCLGGSWDFFDSRLLAF